MTAPPAGPPPAAGRLRIESDLSFSLTDAAGSVTGSVTASGSHVTVRASDPVRAVDGLRGVERIRPRAFGALGEQLAASGLTVDLVGPRGAVLSAGAGIDSPVGRLVLGSRRLRLRSVRAAAELGWARIRPGDRRRAAGLGAAALVAAALVRVGRARRRPRP